MNVLFKENAKVRTPEPPTLISQPHLNRDKASALLKTQRWESRTVDN